MYWSRDVLPIQNQAPQGLLEKSKVRLQPGTPPTLSNVHVRGPKDQIQILSDPKHEPKPVALLKLNPQDADGLWHTGTLRIIDLPKDVEPTPEDASRTIEYKLVPITDPE